MKKDRFNLLVFEALKFFIENPYDEVYLREFAKKVNVNPNTAQRFLNLFLGEELIKEEKKANLRYFKANLENPVLRHIKKTYSIKKIIDSKLVDYLKEQGFSSIILYGSVAKGEDDRRSDIDMLCIGNKKKLELSEVYSKLEKEMNVSAFSFAEWKKQKKENKAFYDEIILHGINLYGEIPLI
jgi:predicted nucleotidyltransferase